MTNDQRQTLKAEITCAARFMAIETNNDGALLGVPYFGATPEDAIEELQSDMDDEYIGESMYVLFSLGEDIKRLVVKDITEPNIQERTKVIVKEF